MDTPDAVFKLNLKLYGHRYSQLDQENLWSLVAEWTSRYPEDNFTCIPASNAPNENDVDDSGLQEIEQDDDDEVFSSRSTNISTSFFFCHQS